MKYSNGDIYEGVFEYDLCSKQGKMIYKDGLVYEGSWVNGLVMIDCLIFIYLKFVINNEFLKFFSLVVILKYFYFFFFSVMVKGKCFIVIKRVSLKVGFGCYIYIIFLKLIGYFLVFC